SASACTFAVRSEPEALASFVTTFSSQTRPSAIAFCRPALAASLKDLSPRPPTSNATPTFMSALHSTAPPVEPEAPVPPVAPLAPELSSLLLHAAATSPIKSSGTANRKKRLHIHFPPLPLPCPAGYAGPATRIVRSQVGTVKRRFRGRLRSRRGP